MFETIEELEDKVNTLIENNITIKEYNEIYNQSGKIILTGNKDVDYNILSELNILELSRICTTNKYSAQICSDENFWRYKFNKENLDILLSPNSHLFLTLGWMKLYKIVKQAYIDAKNSLTVYNIQYSKKRKTCY